MFVGTSFWHGEMVPWSSLFVINKEVQILLPQKLIVSAYGEFELGTSCAVKKPQASWGLVFLRII
jgi:hypothetical protein